MKIINLQQNTREWLEFRRDHIGSSDAVVIMGDHPSKTQLMLLEEKRHGTSEDPSPAMFHGKAKEKEALEFFNSLTDEKDYIPLVIEDERSPYLSASLDGYSATSNEIVEIKCPFWNTAEQVDLNIYKSRYKWQIAHQLMVSKAKACHLFIYTSATEYKIFTYEASDVLFEPLRTQCAKFHEHMVNFTSPEPTEMDFEEKRSDAWSQAVNIYIYSKSVMEEAKENMEKARESLIKMADGRSCRGSGVRLKRATVKGTINYKDIPALRDLDLEQYRNPSSERWTITEEKNG